MVTSISLFSLSSLKGLRSAVLLLLLASVEALSATVNLAPGLKLPVPDPLIMEVVQAQDSAGGPMLVGELEGQPGYFMAAVKLKYWERNNVLWEKLESEIRTRSDTGELSTGMQGSFITTAGDNVWYRVYQYETDAQQHRQVYYLLKGERNAYWLTMTMVDQVSIDLAAPIARTLIRRIQLTE